MWQPSLLTGHIERIVISDDAAGQIVLYPSLLSLKQASDCFSALRAEVRWSAHRRPMYDRVVDVPRLTASFRLSGDPPPAVRIIAERAVARLGCRFTSAGLNLYRDEHDSVAWHSDADVPLESTIAIVSLGDSRRMMLRRKGNSTKRSLTCELPSGSVLALGPGSQTTWEHRIPKETRTVGPRISVVLRNT
jgi:alkylated DNA repair dioxygenase AlkB